MNATMFTFLGRRCSALLLVLLLLYVTLAAAFCSQPRPPDYSEALMKSLLYFEAQRSGRLPHNQRIAWRDDSGLTDGLEQEDRPYSFQPMPSDLLSIFFSLLDFLSMWVVHLTGSRAWNAKVDLVGGYYDAGDNVKFGLPMAFTVTMLSWGVIEYGRQIAAAGELVDALEAIKWGPDYFIKARTHPNVLWAQILQAC